MCDRLTSAIKFVQMNQGSYLRWVTIVSIFLIGELAQEDAVFCGGAKLGAQVFT